MVTRMKRRRYGREHAVVASTSTSHIIKMGWHGKSRSGKTIPIKLNGFVICRDTMDGDGHPVIDYDIMAKLGFGKEKVDAALSRGFEASADLLPQVLHGVITSDAKRDGDGWAYPGLLSEAYECYGKTGLQCYGDGCKAIRKQQDGTKREIACVPYGTVGADPEDWCEWSGPGRECRYHCRLIACLWVPGADGKPQPLDARLGWSARYRIDTSSEYGGIGALDALDAGAERVQGHLNGIMFALSFARKARRTGGTETAKVYTGNAVLTLDEMGLQLRASDQRRELFAQGQIAAASARLQIEGPGEDGDDAEDEDDGDGLAAAAEARADEPAPTFLAAEVEPEPEPDGEARPVYTVAEARVGELLEALADYLSTVTFEEGIEWAEAWAKHVVYEYEGQRVPIDGLDWFKGGDTPEKSRVRRTILRDICRKIEAEDGRFYVVRQQEVAK